MRLLFSFLLTIGVLSVLAQKPRLIVPTGHTDQLNAVAISPDGKYILTGSGDNTAKLWDLSGREITTYVGHKFAVNAVAFSPDGESVLTGSSDGKAMLWPLAGGKAKKTYSGHTGYVTSVAFSPDGNSILTGSLDNTARLWSTSSGKTRQTLKHASSVHTVAFSPDGQVLLTGEENGTATCWNLAGGGVKLRFDHTGAVKDAVFSPDGQLVLTGCQDGTAKVWNMSGRYEQTIRRLSAVHAVAFSPNGQLLLTGGFEDGVVEVRTITGHKQLEYKGHEWGINAVVFTPDGRHVLSGGADQTARLWNVNGETKQVFDKRSSEISGLALSNDGRLLVSSNFAGAVQVADLSGFSLDAFVAHTNPISAVSIAPDSKTILTGSLDGKAKLFDLSGKELRKLSGHRGQINAVAFSPDSQYLMTASFDRTTRLWPIGGGDPIVMNHPDEVTAAAFSPDGKSILTGCGDRNARLWTLSGEVTATIPITSSVQAIAFSPDGRSFVAGAYNGLTLLYDINGQPIQSFGRPGSEVLSVAFSPDGKTILSGYADQTARLWNIQDGQVQVLTGHSADVSAVLFFPDGKSAVTGSRDGSIKFWDPKAVKEQVSLTLISPKDWVVLTSAGLFNASEGAINAMYYVDQLEVIALEQIKERYYEPHLLRKALGKVPGGIRPVDDLVKLPLFPKVRTAAVQGDSLKVSLESRTGGLGRVALLLDDHIELEANINPAGDTVFALDLNRFSDHFIQDSVNRLSVRTFNTAGSLKSQPYWLSYRPGGVQGRGLRESSSLRSKSKVSLDSIDLYALIVGTSNYRGEQLNLKFPDKDAGAFAEALRTTGTNLFGKNIHITLLTTSADPWPRKPVIAAAIKKIADQADPNDILLVYLSGHGITYPPNSEKGQFYYLTTDILSDKLDDPSILNTQAIAQDTLQEWFRQVTARKRILILDACNSGRVVETLTPGEKSLNSDQRRALERVKDRSGMFVLAGSAADKSSYEASRFGHGLLTYSLLNNMPLVATQNKTLIEVGELFNAALDDVPRLAKDIDRVQKPELIGSGSWPIGIIKGEPPYPIPQAIPVFLRTNFIDSKRNRDLKRLSKAVNQTLEQMAGEKQAQIAFWNVDEFAGEHYYLGGKYQVTDDKISGDATLYKKDTEVASFNFGPGDTVEGLAQQIMDSVIEHFNQQGQN